MGNRLTAPGRDRRAAPQNRKSSQGVARAAFFAARESGEGKREGAGEKRVETCGKIRYHKEGAGSKNTNGAVILITFRR